MKHGIIKLFHQCQDTTVDFGAGLKIEGFNEDMGYLI